MSDQPDTFDREFRRRARGLRRTPAARNWSRLEHRLDRRGRRGRLLSLRPWMIAAVLLLVAGVGALTVFADRPVNPLAQRAQSVEELDAPYVAPPFVHPEYLPEGEEGRGDKVLVPRDQPQLAVAPKYRL